MTEAALEWNKQSIKGKRKRVMIATGKLGITAPFGQVACSDRTEKKVLQPMNIQVWRVPFVWLPDIHRATPALPLLIRTEGGKRIEAFGSR